MKISALLNEQTAVGKQQTISINPIDILTTAFA